MKYQVLQSLGAWNPPDVIDDSDLPEGRAEVFLQRGVIAPADGEFTTLPAEAAGDLQAQLDAANAQIADLQAKGSPKAKDLQAQLDAATVSGAGLYTKIEGLTKELADTKGLFDTSQAEFAELQTKYDAANSLLSVASEEELAAMKARAEAKS